MSQQLNVQTYLSSNSLEKLHEELGINYTISDDGKLVILNYDMIESPKYHPVVKECRGLTLEVGTWRVVAKTFSRFFNIGEDLEGQKNFNWDNFVIQEKLDGSLLSCHNYNSQWNLHTRGSFGTGVINGSTHTWRSLFLPLIKNLEQIDPNITLVCEGVSLFNKIVTSYPETGVYLLTAFDNRTCEELSIEHADELAKVLWVKRPQVFQFREQESLMGWLESSELHPTFEGVVVRDDGNRRMKIKRKEYVTLHKLYNNTNLFLPKYLVPIILKGELDEVLIYFPELKPIADEANAVLNQALEATKSVHDKANGVDSQKEYAILISQTPCRAVGFTARKEKRPFMEVWNESADYLVKTLFK